MTEQATMRLRNITCLDHAYINGKGQVIGGSYHVSVDIGGKVDAQEQVVVDFSTIKKDLKAIIDAKEDGFDHKLWWIPGFSNGGIQFLADGSVCIVTPALELTQPANSVRYFELEMPEGDDLLTHIQAELKNHIWKKLLAKHPGVDITVDVVCTTSDFSIHPNKVQFRYVHGLKNSTSWGCQNISHGHTSFAEWTYNEYFSETCEQCRAGVTSLMYAFQYLNDAILIFDENIVNKDTFRTDEFIVVRYTTERGLFRAAYRRTANKFVVMPHETTIENILAWFKRVFKSSLEMAHVKEMFISEGLAKGAVASSETGQW